MILLVHNAATFDTLSSLSTWLMFGFRQSQCPSTDPLATLIGFIDAQRLFFLFNSIVTHPAAIHHGKGSPQTLGRQDLGICTTPSWRPGHS